MSIHKAEAVWTGGLFDGKGHIKSETGAVDADYALKYRTGEAKGPTPEELIGAAHAGCFSMALSAALGQAKFTAKKIHTTASVSFGKVGDDFAITKIELLCEAEIPGIDAAKFKELANGAKVGCPVSKALAATPITLDAKLIGG